jgi:hypothetical protein
VKLPGAITVGHRVEPMDYQGRKPESKLLLRPGRLARTGVASLPPGQDVTIAMRAKCNCSLFTARFAMQWSGFENGIFMALC